MRDGPQEIPSLLIAGESMRALPLKTTQRVLHGAILGRLAHAGTKHLGMRVSGKRWRLGSWSRPADKILHSISDIFE